MSETPDDAQGMPFSEVPDVHLALDLTARVAAIVQVAGNARGATGANGEMLQLLTNSAQEAARRLIGKAGADLGAKS